MAHSANKYVVGAVLVVGLLLVLFGPEGVAFSVVGSASPATTAGRPRRSRSRPWTADLREQGYTSSHSAPGRGSDLDS